MKKQDNIFLIDYRELSRLLKSTQAIQTSLTSS
ncbi:Uncharacterised protein [Suttonella ornithocola]|uniref:Uncharacterized protein n=1 Tax=Suttonella ornithocola TaxID=279832 RepID=A0A380MWX8_9GAMM|nr:Uncharacterised protein [Suttonella ornithocola]